MVVAATCLDKMMSCILDDECYRKRLCREGYFISTSLMRISAIMGVDNILCSYIVMGTHRKEWLSKY